MSNDSVSSREMMADKRPIVLVSKGSSVIFEKRDFKVVVESNKQLQMIAE
jgi:hypothetical protein